MSGQSQIYDSQGKQVPEQLKRFRPLVLLAVTLVLVVFIVMTWTILALRQKADRYAATMAPEATGSITDPSPKSDQLAAFLDACEKDFHTKTMGQPDYSKALTFKSLDEQQTYSAHIRVPDAPLPDKTSIGYEDPQNPAIQVECVVAARLRPVDNGLLVSSGEDEPGSFDPDWVLKQFTASGVVDWSWTVKPLKPGHHELRLELQPAVASQQVARGEYILASEGTTLGTTFRTTPVDVHPTFIQNINQWVADNAPKIQYSALAVLGVASMIMGGVWRSIGKIRKARRDALAP